MGPVVDSNEAMRCEYISTILHTAVSILGDLVITPQANIIGKENTGRIDYAIISEMLEEIICITKGKQNQAIIGICQNLLQCQSACDVSLTNSTTLLATVDEAFDPDYEYVYSIVSTGTTEDALKDNTELRMNVKRILEVIVGLLKNRVLGSEEPATKKRRIEEIIKKK
ncbi:hypothetical protein RhiirA1_474361 [Rhizophagus irregularis]|uniref:Uncharacterized protein n=1 Tax=Rhizophagus irregularis TaxID=588596 RepID=A0A2N0QYP0_9GLOM|nr:hypothetical protein RhiirA1_474361 [Rhizophagus irregularis]